MSNFEVLYKQRQADLRLVSDQIKLVIEVRDNDNDKQLKALVGTEVYRYVISILQDLHLKMAEEPLIEETNEPIRNEE
jgi:hypothetical protein